MFERASLLLGVLLATTLAAVVAAPALADHTGVSAAALVQHNGSTIAEYSGFGTCQSNDSTQCGVGIPMNKRDANRFLRWCGFGDGLDVTISAGNGSAPFICQGPSGWTLAGSVALEPRTATHSQDVHVHVVPTPA